jgi:arsenate reductase
VTHTREVLFLCTGNSCRSQMAEAIVNARFPDWKVFSGGVRPAGFVHPLAIRVLQELEIEHRGTSKSVEGFRDQAFDLVVTVCDDANEVPGVAREGSSQARRISRCRQGWRD